MIIEKILIEGQGWKYRKDGEFKETSKNGEMASVPWILQLTKEGIKEYNCKYVIQIDYNEEKKMTENLSF